MEVIELSPIQVSVMTLFYVAIDRIGSQIKGLKSIIESMTLNRVQLEILLQRPVSFFGDSVDICSKGAEAFEDTCIEGQARSFQIYWDNFRTLSKNILELLEVRVQKSVIHLDPKPWNTIYILACIVSVITNDALTTGPRAILESVFTEIYVT
ncbi:hypothetical protein RF11_10858 [Thelohanellus kitauei]|uniref:Uncharacterized protein n=1 Tax=Thelohanellus kitauei TaxID=669202 RepID=A0A0C2JNK0_THEKT|nr:hypothetical protein RF11_10858 [Thelohanellus kitauei]